MSETKTGPTVQGAAAPATNGMAWLEEYADLIPNLDELVTEDGKPVDNVYVEKLYKLLTDPLYVSWRPPGAANRPFVAMSNVGWFFDSRQPPLVPNVMVSLDVAAVDPGTREGRSYFSWLRGKPPDLVIEVVSDQRADEWGAKMQRYALNRLLYYVIHDPFGVYDEGVLRAFALRVQDGSYEPIDHRWIEYLGLGLTMWEGTYQGINRSWLRWCDRDGKVLPTGEERAAAERQRADAAEERADHAADLIRRLQAQLRGAGIEPQG
jgi:hypothetical protein